MPSMSLKRSRLGQHAITPPEAIHWTINTHDNLANPPSVDARIRWAVIDSLLESEELFGGMGFDDLLDVTKVMKGV